MRRGKLVYDFHAPWKLQDDPTKSLNDIKNIKTRVFRQHVALTIFSVSISIIIWRLQHYMFTRNLEAKQYGFVLPLYYQENFPNTSYDLKHTIWYENKATRHRRGRKLNYASPRFLLWESGYSIYYVKLTLGNPGREFFFHVDTGSTTSWVYCDVPNYKLKHDKLGLNGLYVPHIKTIVKCSQEPCTKLECNRLPCLPGSDCRLKIKYVDQSSYTGCYVHSDFRVQMHDGVKKIIPGYHGCITQESNNPYDDPNTDGILAIGNGDHNLFHQWTMAKWIDENVYGICIGTIPQQQTGKRPRQETNKIQTRPVGFMFVGKKIEQTFDRSSSPWMNVLPPRTRSCRWQLYLVAILFENTKIKHGVDPRSDEFPITFDTGSIMTWLHQTYYDQLYDVLTMHAFKKGYTIVAVSTGDTIRACWQRHNTRPSMKDFPDITFVFGEAFDNYHQRLTNILHVTSNNYLEYSKVEHGICTLFAEGEPAGSVIGSHAMREHLFVFDQHNQRMRWKPSTCQMH